MADETRIVVADDDALLRTSLAAVLAIHGDIRVVGEASDGPQAVALISDQQPDVALVDLEMPGCDGIQVTAQLTHLSTKIIIVTRHARPYLLNRALSAGAAGFALKSTSSEDLASIIASVHAGKRYVDSEIAALALTARSCPLTPRELEILSLLQSGLRVGECADAMRLAPGTVRNYVSSILASLNVSSSHEAARMAHAEGWI